MYFAQDSKMLSFLIYADDTRTFKINEWLKINKVSLNAAKYIYMKFQTAKKNIHLPVFTMKTENVNIE